MQRWIQAAQRRRRRPIRVSTSALSQVGSRTGAPVRPGHPSRATFPVPSTSHAACGFPALRAPICFTPGLMGPITLGRLSVRRVALDSY